MVARAIASVLVCNGCCCGHTEKGRPALPKSHVEKLWADRQLARVARLRFVDCLGPCEQANLAVVKVAGETVWLAGLSSIAEYEALADWAAQAGAAATLAALPAVLAGRQIPPHGDA